MSLYTINNEDLRVLKDNENFSLDICKSIKGIENYKAKEIYEYLIKFCEENNLIKAHSYFNYYLGWLNYDLLNLDESIKCHQIALKGFKSINYKEGIIFATNGLFVDYMKKQEFKKAIALGIRGIKIASEENNYKALSVLKSNMLGAYYEIGEYEKAIELYDDIEKIGYVGKLDNQIANNINRCSCEFKLGNKDNSIKYGEKAYELAKKDKNNYFIPNILTELANVYIDKGEFDTALQKLNEAREYIKNQKNDIRKLYILISLGDLYLKMKNYKLAIEKYKKAFNIGLNDSYKNELKDIYRKLSIAYKSMEDYKKSIEYIEKYIELDESIQKEMKFESIKKLDNSKEEENEAYRSLYMRVDSIYEFCKKITSNLDKENIVKIIVDEIRHLIECDTVQIGLYREGVNLFEFLLCLEEGKRIEMPPITINDKSFNGYCIKENKEILINDMENEYDRYINIEKNKTRKNTLNTNNKKCNSAMFMPLTINDNPIGVISVQSYEKRKYNLKDLNTLKIIASFISIALKNSKLYKEIGYFAKHDYLTGVLNKGEVLKEAEKIYANAMKNKESISVMMIDIDNFKNINDTYGHQFGDKVIQNIAEEIKKSIRKDDIVGRYGGEEFIVFFNGNSQKDYLAISERIRCNIQKLHIENKSGERINITCSIGVVYKGIIKETLNNLINIADMALYKAKNTGKNKVVVIK